MFAAFRSKASPFVGVVVLVVLATGVKGADEKYPVQGLTPRQSIGGPVSIPGAPLPPVSRESVKAAILIYRPILAGFRVLGPSPALARGCGYLATLYASIGEVSRAEQLFDEAQTILEKDAATGRDLGWVHNNRGLVRMDQEQYAGAIQSFRAAAAALPPDRRELLGLRVIALQNLASVQQRIGDLQSSEDAYLEGLDILRRLGKERDRTSQFTRTNLALLYSSMGDLEASRTILEDLVTQPRLPPDLEFAILNNLGYVFNALGDFPGAEKRLREALALSREASRRALVLTNLAATYFNAGDFDRSQRAGEEALQLAEEVHGADSRSAAAIAATLGATALARGDLAKAESLLTRARRTLSRESGDPEALAKVTGILALVAQRRGDPERAVDSSRQALDLEKRNLERILAFGSEAQRLAYRSNAQPYDALANLGDGPLLAEAVLTMKGAVLESLLRERALVRASKRPADQERLDRIHALRVELMERTGSDEGELAPIERALKQQETALARSLAQPLWSGPKRADLARTQQALEDGQVLIEIIRFKQYQSNGKLVPWYGGVVIPRRGSPVWVLLSRAAILEELIESLVERLDRGGRGVKAAPVAGDVERTLHELDDRLWKPLARSFPAGTRKVVLSPDGATHFVPWAALLDENDVFLAERCLLTQVGSGRDLLRAKTSAAGKTLLALADGKDDLRFSREEAEDLGIRAEKQGWTATILLGAQASETALFRHPNPRLLHFATHGGELQDDATRAVENRLSRNPMYRGYLLLGGAAKTFDQWKRGTIIPFSEDGILTAEEVAGLDLRNTWLTVLSACRSGAGDARIGEGVLGLRRGFTLAGTENLLFSLWSVDDAFTAQFMEAFYERLFRTSDPARAFQQAQLAELRRWREAGDIPAAVARAGGFVLTR